MTYCRATWEGGSCDRPAACKGLCQAHYMQARKGQSFKQAKGQPGWCSVDGCGRPRKAHGLCGPHYNRLLRTGTVGVLPIGERKPSERLAEKVQEAIWLLQSAPPSEVAKRLGYRSPESFARSLHRVGEHELARKIERKAA